MESVNNLYSSRTGRRITANITLHETVCATAGRAPMNGNFGFAAQPDPDQGME